MFWHSSAHVLGEAMERVYGGHLCYGPPIENGFYYDMHSPECNVSTLLRWSFINDVTRMSFTNDVTKMSSTNDVAQMPCFWLLAPFALNMHSTEGGWNTKCVRFSNGVHQHHWKTKLRLKTEKRATIGIPYGFGIPAPTAKGKKKKIQGQTRGKF